MTYSRKNLTQSKTTYKWLFATVILSALTLTNHNSYAQQNRIKIKGIKIKKQDIHFDIQENNIAYLKLEDDHISPRDITNQTFSLTDSYANLKFGWKNPLKYTLTWKDSTYVDEQQAELKDFFKSLTPLFSLPTSTNTASSSASLSHAKAVAHLASNAIDAPNGGFKDYELTQLYIQLILAKELIKPEERANINKLTPKLKELETESIDYQSKAKQTFTNLFNEENPDRISTKNKDGIADIESDNIASWTESLNKNTKLQEQLVSQLADIKIENELYNSLFHTIISKYLDKNKEVNLRNTGTINRLKPLVEKLKASVTGVQKLYKYGERTDMTIARAIKLEEGSVLQTELIITKHKISADGLTIEKDKDIVKTKLIFRGYDPINFSISTGIFYSSTSLNGFGIATNGNDLVVVEENIKKNTAVTAVFGNFTYGFGSRLLAPTLQLGIDPTKRHPFFLAGGGFAFPVANFAITSGGIWTFEPTLSKLQPNQKIASTIELEKDIKNNFKTKPKGWYLGIQYNF